MCSSPYSPSRSDVPVRITKETYTTRHRTHISSFWVSSNSFSRSSHPSHGCLYSPLLYYGVVLPPRDYTAPPLGKMSLIQTFAMAVIEFFFQLLREQIELLLSSWNFILVFFISSDIWFAPWKFKIFMKIWIIISTHHQYSFFKILLFQLFFLSHYGWSFFRTAAVSSSNFMGAASYGASYTISHTVYMRWEGPYIQHSKYKLF